MLVLAANQAGTDRHPRTEPLGQRCDIRLDTDLLIAEPATGTPHATLDLVTDHQQTTSIAQLPNLLIEVRISQMDTPFALDDLKHHGNNIVVMLYNMTNCLEIAIGNPNETAHQRLETGLRLAVAGCRKRCHRPAMKCLFHHDDGGQFDLLLMPVKTSQLDCRFVGFGPRIAEEHLAHAGQRAQLVGKLLLFANTVQIGGMQHAAGLGGNSRNQLRVGVTQRRDSDAGQCVQILPALGIGNPAPLPVTKSHWQTSIGIHDMRHEATSENENGGKCRRNDHHHERNKPVGQQKAEFYEKNKSLYRTEPGTDTGVTARPRALIMESSIASARMRPRKVVSPANAE